ncbi:MAG: hypothetical protein K2X81_02360, partial [Candidatus Obscuribacterales bacterium]|nr:hypothetical protein [Candidatus Obscuribacterales bacterium]
MKAVLFITALISVSTASAYDSWHIAKSYETLPCLSLQQTKLLKQIKQDGPDTLITEADTFYEKTKKFFSTHDRFICPPTIEEKHEFDFSTPMKFGSVDNYELIHINQWQMEVLEGRQQKLIWKMGYDKDTGVGKGKNRPFVLVPLSPKDSDEAPYLVHALKSGDKWKVHVCYPVER